MKDALGRDLSVGCTVAHVRRQGSSVQIGKRKVAELEGTASVRLYEQGSDTKVSRALASCWNLVVIPE